MKHPHTYLDGAVQCALLLLIASSLAFELYCLWREWRARKTKASIIHKVARKTGLRVKDFHMEDTQWPL